MKRPARYDARALTRAIRVALSTPSDVAMFRIVARDGGAFMASFTVHGARTQRGWTQIILRDDGEWFTVRAPGRIFLVRYSRGDGCTHGAFLEWKRNGFRQSRDALNRKASTDGE